jgi:hypothetical protein
VSGGEYNASSDDITINDDDSLEGASVKCWTEWW